MPLILFMVVALPTLVTGPVRLALVVTVVALRFPLPSRFTIWLAPVPLFTVKTGVVVPVAMLISELADETLVTVPLLLLTGGMLSTPFTKVGVLPADVVRLFT